MVIYSKDITQKIAPVKIQDSIASIEALMRQEELFQLPVVCDEGLYLGMVNQEHIDSIEQKSEALGSIKNNTGAYTQYPPVLAQDHFYTALTSLVNNNLTAIAVVDEANKYIGCITWDYAIEGANIAMGLDTIPGGILVLKRKSFDFAPSEIARLCEGEGCKIVSLGANPESNGEGVYITLKVNKKDIQALISAFERFEYQVVATFGDIPHNSHLQERYDLLMRYLDL